jgi:hypothetical protein
MSASIPDWDGADPIDAELQDVDDVAGAGIPDWRPEERLIPFEETWISQLHKERVVQSDNDLIVGLAAASKSAGSGTGKTTAGIQLGRRWDYSKSGWNAEEKATLDSTKFVKGLLNNPDRVPHRSSVIFDEATGTLSDSGADARRSMATSVMNITKGLATLRYRQVTAIIIAQSTHWLDSRLRDVLDALILIQERGKAVVYQPYRNDFNSTAEYNARKGELRWDALEDPANDPDYQHLEKLKRESTKRQVDQQAREEALELSDEQKRYVAKNMRKRGVQNVTIATALDMSESWVSKHTKSVASA